MKRKVAAGVVGGVAGGARRWFTGVVTTLAAMMALMVNARSLGLSPWLGLFDPNYADGAATRIVLTPRGDTLRALGDTAQVLATVTDARGGALLGATLRWKSNDSTVASVDTSGAIVARAPGRATIEVSVRALSASVAILVRPTPDRVVLVGDSVRTLADGDSLAIDAQVLDARGHPITTTALRWLSTDSSIVLMDSAGVARARAPGRARVTASIGEVSAALDFTVRLTPAELVLDRGGEQRAQAGRVLAEPIVVRVLTRTGQPVPATTVLVATENGEGSVPLATVATDAQGRVRVPWTLGRRAGVQRLIARLPDVDSALTVVADADPLPTDTRIEPFNAELGGEVGREIGEPIRVRVTDTLGVALAHVRTAWATTDGGSVSGGARTDSAGWTEARWTLGPRAGMQRTTLSVGNPRFISATTFRATATPGAARRLRLVAGDAQRATVGSALPKPISLRVTDSLGNAVSGASVRAMSSAGALSDSIFSSGADGSVHMKWTLGERATAQRVDAQLVGTEERLALTATARVGAPAAIELVVQRGSSRGTTRLVARVQDAHGNAVVGGAVAVAASGGKLNVMRVRTDSAGRAQVTWISSAASRTAVRITATVVGTKLSATHTVPPSGGALP